MTADNMNALDKIKFLHKSICNECESYIFYPPETSRRIFLRIRNAADKLLLNAQSRIWHKQNTADDAVSNSDFKTIEDILSQINGELAETDFPAEKEDKVKNILRSFAINPDKFLILYAEQLNPSRILSGE